MPSITKHFSAIWNECNASDFLWVITVSKYSETTLDSHRRCNVHIARLASSGKLSRTSSDHPLFQRILFLGMLQLLGAMAEFWSCLLSP
ncbi:hypothetical protein AcV5_004262 [Taiwanofungus camphoratus]|nr:hypothetical protein AcV5_004262 [Antrodia cinnamomea]